MVRGLDIRCPMPMPMMTIITNGWNVWEDEWRDRQDTLSCIHSSVLSVYLSICPPVYPLVGRRVSKAELQRYDMNASTAQQA